MFAISRAFRGRAGAIFRAPRIGTLASDSQLYESTEYVIMVVTRRHWAL
jgi:hypothetical protein